MCPKLKATVIVPCLFRVLNDSEDLPCYRPDRYWKNPTLKNSSLAQTKLPEGILEFLFALDQKLDFLIDLAKQTNLEKNFPHRGNLLSLSPEKLILDCIEPLAPKDQLETVLFLQEFPLNSISCRCHVEKIIRKEAAPHESENRFLLRINRLDEEQKDQLIHFIFQEERRRIRREKATE